jgi:hypothetical protein
MLVVFITDTRIPSDKGIDNIARQLSTSEARQAKPKCNPSRDMSSCRIPIL